MIKLKSAVDYLQEIQDDGVRLLSAQVEFILINKIKSIQQNAIEATLNVVKESCTILSVPNNEFEVIDKQSITSLINHKDLKL